MTSESSVAVVVSSLTGSSVVSGSADLAIFSNSSLQPQKYLEVISVDNLFKDDLSHSLTSSTLEPITLVGSEEYIFIA